MYKYSFFIVSLCIFWANEISAQQTVESEGIAIDFSWQRVGDNQAHFDFHIRDTTNGAPVLGVYPAAWVHPSNVEHQSELESRHECQKQAETFIGGSLFSRADIDLNQYYVVTMNDDASLSVVDPLFGFGGSKLLNRVILPSVAHDWVLSQDGRYMWLSFPESQSIGRLNTATWQLQTIALSAKPQQLVLQSDQAYVWVGLNDAVVAVSVEDIKVIKSIVLPSQPEELLLSGDDRSLYVTLPEIDQIAMIDTAQLMVKQIQKTGKEPISLGYSRLAQLLYVANHSGSVDVFNVDDLNKVVTIQSQPGIAQLRFEPNGRWGFMVNPETDRLSIIDAASNRIVQTGLVESQPVSVDFSNDLAYIKHRNSSTVLMISLDDHEIGRAGAPIPVVDTPGGDYPPGQQASRVASGIVKAPGANAVLIANPKDQAVYFYKEGMAAPMGQFGNYGQSPRAVLALDRSLRDIDGQGHYQTIAELPKTAQRQDVVFFMDSPRRVYCFEMDVGPTASITEMVTDEQFVALSNERGYQVNKAMQLQFNGNPNAVSEVDVIVSTNSGLWRQRKSWPVDKKGALLISFIPPIKGLYHLQYMSNDTGQFKELGDKWYEVQ